MVVQLLFLAYLVWVWVLGCLFLCFSGDLLNVFVFVFWVYIFVLYSFGLAKRPS